MKRLFLLLTLLAALACPMANAGWIDAQFYNQVGRVTVTHDNAVTPIQIPLCLQFFRCDDFIDFEFTIKFPQGVKPDLDENGNIGTIGEDISKDENGQSLLSIDCQLVQDGVCPVYHVIATNATRTPITVNPVEFFRLNVIADQDYPYGERCATMYVVYRDSKGNEGHYGSTALNALGVLFFFSDGYYDPQPAQSLRINTPNITLTLNESYGVKTTIQPHPYALQDFTWETSAPDIVSVDAQGVITGVALGSAVVKATTTDGTRLTDSCRVTVTDEQFGLRAPSRNIYATDIGKTFELPISLRMPFGYSLSDIYMRIRFPEGLHPGVEGEGEYACHGWPGDDVPQCKSTHYHYSHLFDDNLGDDDEYPDYWVHVYPYIYWMSDDRYITANPCHFYTMLVSIDSTFTAGEREMLYWGDYYNSDNIVTTFGQADKMLPLARFRFIDGIKGAINADEVTDIDDVNAMLNVLLGKRDPSPRCHLNNDDLIDLDDLNQLINILLKR